MSYDGVTTLDQERETGKSDLVFWKAAGARVEIGLGEASIFKFVTSKSSAKPFLHDNSTAFTFLEDIIES